LKPTLGAIVNSQFRLASTAKAATRLAANNVPADVEVTAGDPIAVAPQASPAQGAASLFVFHEIETSAFSQHARLHGRLIGHLVLVV
jgi:hypothetical protein